MVTKTIEQEIQEHELGIAFIKGVEFEGLRSMLNGLIHDFPLVKDNEEREAMKRLAKYSFDEAEKLAKKYEAVALFQGHVDSYERFQEISR